MHAGWTPILSLARDGHRLLGRTSEDRREVTSRAVRGFPQTDPPVRRAGCPSGVGAGPAMGPQSEVSRPRPDRRQLMRCHRVQSGGRSRFATLRIRIRPSSLRAPSRLRPPWVIQEVVVLPVEDEPLFEVVPAVEDEPLVQVMPPIKDIPRSPPIPMITGPRGL